MNLWRIRKNLLFYLFAAKHWDEKRRPSENIRLFRRFLRIELYKGAIGLPIVLSGVWLLFFAPFPGYGFLDIIHMYTTMTALSQLFWAPVCMLLCLVPITAFSYVLYSLMFVIGWVQVTWLGYKR